MTVSLVVISHSAKLAEGVVELAGQMAQGKVAIAAAGGTAEGDLGTSVERILAALEQVASPEGTLILLDLGSAVMAAEMAVEQFTHDRPYRVTISSGPLVEGAVIAAVEASVGNTLEEVADAALHAMTLPKVQNHDRASD
jgi:phosphoenolpyruvate---glycerone phosphotransferase subunit DhaM